MKLFCLSYAGGNASFYDPLAKYISNGIEFIKLEYSGHGNRRKEPFYASFKELAQDLYKTIKDNLANDDEYALFGYSMGSIGVIELLKEINKKAELTTPKHVFIAAHEPNTIKAPNYTNDELDALVKKRTIQLGGVPEKLVENSSFWRTYLPVICADYKMIINYSFEESDYKTDISTSVIFSEEDTPFVEMQKWGRIFVGNVEYYKFCGNHFFIKENEKEIADIINSKIGKEN